MKPCSTTWRRNGTPSCSTGGLARALVLTPKAPSACDAHELRASGASRAASAVALAEAAPDAAGAVSGF